MIHAEPRYTKDLNVFLAPDFENISRFCEALTEFGFPLSEEASKELALPNRMISIGFRPSRIDILNALTGVEFDSAWPGRLEIEVDGVNVSFIGLKELIETKRASGRPQDLIDVQELEKAQKPD